MIAILGMSGVPHGICLSDRVLGCCALHKEVVTTGGMRRHWCKGVVNESGPLGRTEPELQFPPLRGTFEVCEYHVVD